MASVFNSTHIEWSSDTSDLPSDIQSHAGHLSKYHAHEKLLNSGDRLGTDVHYIKLHAAGY